MTTDQGLTGWGESFGFTGVPVTRRAIDAVIAPLCVGRDATHIGALMGEIQEKLSVFGRGGPFTHGLSAVDIALWDIAGKAAGAPLHRLLGGGRGDLPCYASLDAYSDPDLVRAAVANALGAGFSAIKLHEREFPVVRAGREEAGPDVALMIDVNTAWTVNQAQAMAAELLDFGRLLDAGAVDFVQPSPAKMGGITELAKVFTAAAMSNVTPMLHSFYDGPGLLAAIHATAALGAVDSMIEWRFFDLEANVYRGALTPDHGRVQVPQTPGLGLDPDPEVLSTYRLKT